MPEPAAAGANRAGGVRKDITGRRYGSLVALAPTEKRLRSSIVWHCKCDCGADAYASVKDLNRGAKLSCGCRLHRPPEEYHTIRSNLHYQDNTCIERLRSVLNGPCRNKTGVRGVRRLKNGTYAAYITFQKQRIHLGTFQKLGDAAEQRRRAETELQRAYLEQCYGEK